MTRRKGADERRKMKDDLAGWIYSVAHLTGEFSLRSGRVSHEYFDKYLGAADPELLDRIAESMVPLIPAGTEVPAGLKMGGIPIATAPSLKTGLPAAFARKRAKEYGTCKLAEGAAVAGRRVCIVEDVITTGGQVIASADELRAAGARVEHVICVIERDVAGRNSIADAGLALPALFTMDELEKNASFRKDR